MKGPFLSIVLNHLSFGFTEWRQPLEVPEKTETLIKLF